MTRVPPCSEPAGTLAVFHQFPTSPPWGRRMGTHAVGVVPVEEKVGGRSTSSTFSTGEVLP